MGISGIVDTSGSNEALQIIDLKKPFDLIITDQTMPGMTGLDLIRYLRESGKPTPVIILSGNARYVSKEDLAGLGNVHFMPKPFELSALLERIAVTLALARESNDRN